MHRTRSILARIRPLAAAALAFTSILSITGCAFQQHREELAHLHATGQDPAALNLLESPDAQKLYGDNDRLVYLLDHGSLMLMSGQQTRAIDDFEQAEKLMDYGGNKTAADTIAQWLLNDTAAAYVGEPYESIYVNVLKLCAQLTRTEGRVSQSTGQGIISGGATVEARRAAAKADFLRDRFASTQTALNSEIQNQRDVPPQAASEASRVANAAPPATAGQFIESPLGTYLTAVTFMKSGEPSLQEVAGRRLADSIQKQGGLIGNVNPEAFKSIGTLDATDANVLIVAFSGIGPTKAPQRVGPIPIYTYPLYFELPVLRITPSSVVSVRATLTPHQASESNPPQLVELNLVENLASVAEENHKRELPQIYQRTLIRATIRSTANVVATEAIRKSSSRGNRDAVEVAGMIGGLLAMSVLERADLRCWIFLPGQAHVALAKLPAGTFDATIEYLDASGRVVDTRTRKDLTAADGPSALATALTFTTR